MGLHMQSELGATGTRILQNLSNERVQLHSTTLEDRMSKRISWTGQKIQDIFNMPIQRASSLAVGGTR